MSTTIDEQIARLKNTIHEMEAQRDSLGDAVVQQALRPLQEKLAELERLLEVSKSPAPEKPLQQRKLLTILFMDIVGSTSIIQHMDPEDVSEIFDANLKRLAQPVEAFGGHVTRFMGDGFMAIFGVPTAREDEPERAVRAGLSIIQRSEEIATELEKDREIHKFKVRVGVNTGLVILGGATEGQDTTEGPAVHLAARLQSAAPPGGLLVSHDTYRHIRGVFDVEAWEPLKVKGFDDLVRVYQIVRAKPRAFRSYTRGVEGVETSMVGRHDELKYLQDALLSAIEENEGQVITITSEAGVGKSRLLYEFQNWIDLQVWEIRFHKGRAMQEAQGMPLAMLRDLFEFRFQLQENATLVEVRRKVEAGFAEIFGEGDDGQMRSHILGQWLGFDFSTSPHLKGVLADPEQLRNRGLMYLGEYFKGLCAQAPVVVFLEDIHWADDSSLDTLNWLGERLQHQRLLFVCAARHTLLERRPYWGEGLAYHHCMELGPLSKRESHQLVDEILKLAIHVPAELSELVVEGAEGNPFYVEELVKMLVEDGAVVKGEDTWQVRPERLSEIKVPPTLAGVLQARLESLPQDEQQVLQQASVVGRLFWDRAVSHIQSVEGGKPEAVPEVLTSLRGREMVYRRESSAFTDAREYLFKHDILREVTYESVLKKLRSRYHGLVAEWLITQAGERADEHSGLIARHLLQAGRKDQAGVYFLQAGQTALASFANTEAEGYFRLALEQPLKDTQEAACLGGLGEALIFMGKRDESSQVLQKGIDLYLEMGNSDQAAALYRSLARSIWFSNYQKSWETCQEGLKRLEGAPESSGMAYLLAEAGRAAYFINLPKDEVIRLCQRALEMAEHVGELKAKAEALINLAMGLEDSDLEKSFHLLEEAVEFCETNKLWPQAMRAHNNLGVYFGEQYQSVESSFRHYMRATDIPLQMGAVEQLFLSLGNLSTVLLAMGHQNTIEARLTEILHKSTAPQSRINIFLDEVRADVSYGKGQWTLPLDFYRSRAEEYRKTRNFQGLLNVNFNLANICLELNRFTDLTDLSEAEAAMSELIKIKWSEEQARFQLVTIYARQRQFTKAHDCLMEINNNLVQPKQKTIKVIKLIAESELARAEVRWEEVVTKCQTLIEINQAGGYHWEHARRLIDLGDALMGRGMPGDREQAMSIFRQSLEMFTEMDAPGYIQVLNQRLLGI